MSKGKMLSRATAGLCSADSFFPDHVLPAISNFMSSKITADTKEIQQNLGLWASKTCVLFFFFFFIKKKKVWFYCQ